VILSADPFAMSAERLLALKVLETISQGQSVYVAP
jgi:predicted amidohydrolase YtcJ